jgi:hypothetical protein
VTAVASRGYLATVFIEMAGGAGGVEAEERAPESHLVHRQPSLVLDVLLRMTSATLDRRVFALKMIPGQGMVEILLPVLPVDQIVRPPLVLHVAGLTLFVLLNPVQPGVILHLISHDRVAGQALVRDQLAPGSVALAAVFDPFQEGVALMQFTRGDLSVYRWIHQHTYSDSQEPDNKALHDQTILT